MLIESESHHKCVVDLSHRSLAELALLRQQKLGLAAFFCTGLNEDEYFALYRLWSVVWTHMTFPKHFEVIGKKGAIPNKTKSFSPHPFVCLFFCDNLITCGWFVTVHVLPGVCK